MESEGEQARGSPTSDTYGDKNVEWTNYRSSSPCGVGRRRPPEVHCNTIQGNLLKET